MIKRIRLLLVAVLLIFLILSIAAACTGNEESAPKIPLTINGDIEGGNIDIDLGGIITESFTYQDGEQTLNGNGWPLNSIFSSVVCTGMESDLMFTAEDYSVKIAFDSVSPIYIYKNAEDKLCLSAEEYPRAAAMRDIKEITVVSKDLSPVSGITVVTKNNTEIITPGNAKILFFDVTATNNLNDKEAIKYLKKAGGLTAAEFTDEEKVIAYFQNYNIIKEAGELSLSWASGNMYAEGYPDSPVFGFVTGTDVINYDAYYDMKAALDAGKRVMYILPDGFSYQQVQAYNSELTVLGSGYVRSATVNPAISNVALASMITGQAPSVTGIYERKLAEPACEDIFDYAASIGKTAVYIEGNTKLVLTNQTQILSIQDENGFSDSAVYANALTALQDEPDLTVVHFHGIDDQNHLTGPLSDDAKPRVKIVDGYIASLMEDFDGVVIIAPDHGHITYYNEDQTTYGLHGKFTCYDMYVPYYVLGD